MNAAEEWLLVVPKCPQDQVELVPVGEQWLFENVLQCVICGRTFSREAAS
jgi:hypothetical protein